MIHLPTSRSDWRLLGWTIGRVLGHPSYLVLGIVVTIVAAILMSASQNLQFVVTVLRSDGFGIGFKIEFLVATLPFLGPQYGWIHGLAIYAIASLTGGAVALIAYSLIEHERSIEWGEGRTAGVVLGTLAAECAALGPGILAGIAGILGWTGLLGEMPYGGLEVSMLAAVVLILSSFQLAEGLRDGVIRGDPVEPTETELG